MPVNASADLTPYLISAAPFPCDNVVSFSSRGDCILNHMSDVSIRFICVAFVLVDLTILISYIRAKGLFGGHQSYYGTRLKIHLFSSLLCVITGATAILSYPIPSVAGECRQHQRWSLVVDF